MSVRTDLALEEKELREAAEEGAPSGVRCREWDLDGIHVTQVKIVSGRGAEALHKPVGTYVTMDLTREQVRSSQTSCAEALGETLRQLLPKEGLALVVGLGNEAVTPDAIGPRALHHVLATRHLQQSLPDLFGSFRPVSAIATGVLGSTGMESAEMVRGIVSMLKPGFVVAIDALAAAGPRRLCTSIQVADTGIVPGSGVQNDRKALNKKTLGVPVFSIGVPTVCDLQSREAEQMIVTPSDIDTRVSDLAKIVSMALNQALHPDVSREDLAEFVS